jgi:hypothetical protein
MSIKTKLITSLGVALAPCLLALPASADEVFSVTSVITVPGNPLVSFDIEFVDPAAGVLLLADRSNKSIDVASTSSNLIISQLQPGFAGVVVAGSSACPKAVPPAPRPASCSGPNGVLSIHQYGQGEPQGEGNGRGQAKAEVWAGDGFSRVWVLNLKTGVPVVPPISTALPSNPKDANRADELCYDPDDGIVLIANPSSNPDFVTFISTHNYKVLGHIVLDGTGGTPNATGGIEQCQYSPRTGKFYINVPRATVKGFSTPQDLVLQIDPVSETILQTVNLTTQAPGCVGITGMALGPDHQIAIACGGTNSVVISEKFSSNTTPQVYSLPGETGADEIWYNPGDNHYFYATVLKGGAPPERADNTWRG